MYFSIFYSEDFLFLFMLVLRSKVFIGFELSPNKVNIFTDFINNLPPRSSSGDTLNQHWVVAFANIKFIRVFNLILDLDIDSIGEVDLPEEILVKLELQLIQSLRVSFVGIISHSENKVLSFIWRMSFC